MCTNCEITEQNEQTKNIVMEPNKFEHIPLHTFLEKKVRENSPYFHISYGEPYDNFYHDLYNDLFYKNFVFKNNLKSGYYVEIGALDGVVNSQSFIFEKQLNWDGIVVEPNPTWHEILEIYRKCKISKCAISDKRQTSEFECREIPAFSGLKSTISDYRMSDIKDTILVETITLLDLLKDNNAPNKIDWISIDTEGAELNILTDFFKNNTKYKVNLINFEANDDRSDYQTLKALMKSNGYLKIKNPYLDFLRVCPTNGLVNFQPITGQFYKSLHLVNPIENSDNIVEVNFEHYFIHNDFLQNNLHLKKYII